VAFLSALESGFVTAQVLTIDGASATRSCATLRTDLYLRLRRQTAGWLGLVPMEHPALGLHKVRNAPFKLSETSAFNHLLALWSVNTFGRLAKACWDIAMKSYAPDFADGMCS
jgi:hypothetical protein